MDWNKLTLSEKATWCHNAIRDKASDYCQWSRKEAKKHNTERGVLLIGFDDTSDPYKDRIRDVTFIGENEVRECEAPDLWDACQKYDPAASFVAWILLEKPHCPNGDPLWSNIFTIQVPKHKRPLPESTNGGRRHSTGTTNVSRTTVLGGITLHNKTVERYTSGTLLTSSPPPSTSTTAGLPPPAAMAKQAVLQNTHTTTTTRDIPPLQRSPPTPQTAAVVPDTNKALPQQGSTISSLRYSSIPPPAAVLNTQQHGQSSSGARTILQQSTPNVVQPQQHHNSSGLSSDHSSPTHSPLLEISVSEQVTEVRPPTTVTAMTTKMEELIKTTVREELDQHFAELKNDVMKHVNERFWMHREQNAARLEQLDAAVQQLTTDAEKTDSELELRERLTALETKIVLANKDNINQWPGQAEQRIQDTCTAEIQKLEDVQAENFDAMNSNFRTVASDIKELRNEQHEVSLLFQEFNQQLDQLTAQMNTTAEDQESCAAMIHQLQDAVASAKGDILDIKGCPGVVQVSMKGFLEQLRQLNDKTSSHTEKTEDLSPTELQNQVYQLFSITEQTTQELHSLKQTTNTFKHDIEVSNDTQTAIRNIQTGLDGSITDLHRTMNNTEEKMQRIASQLEGLKTTVCEHISSQHDLNDAAQDKLSEFQKQVSAVHGVQSDVQKAQDRLDDNDRQVSQTAHKLHDIMDDVAALKVKMDCTVDTTISRLQDEVTELTVDMTKCKNGTENISSLHTQVMQLREIVDCIDEQVADTVKKCSQQFLEIVDSQARCTESTVRGTVEGAIDALTNVSSAAKLQWNASMQALQSAHEESTTIARHLQQSLEPITKELNEKMTRTMQHTQTLQKSVAESAASVMTLEAEIKQNIVPKMEQKINTVNNNCATLIKNNNAGLRDTQDTVDALAEAQNNQQVKVEALQQLESQHGTDLAALLQSVNNLEDTVTPLWQKLTQEVGSQVEAIQTQFHQMLQDSAQDCILQIEKFETGLQQNADQTTVATESNTEDCEQQEGGVDTSVTVEVEDDNSEGERPDEVVTDDKQDTQNDATATEAPTSPQSSTLFDFRKVVQLQLKTVTSYMEAQLMKKMDYEEVRERLAALINQHADQFGNLRSELTDLCWKVEKTETLDKVTLLKEVDVVRNEFKQAHLTIRDEILAVLGQMAPAGAAPPPPPRADTTATQHWSLPTMAPVENNVQQPQQQQVAVDNGSGLSWGGVSTPTPVPTAHTPVPPLLRADERKSQQNIQDPSLAPPAELPLLSPTSTPTRSNTSTLQLPTVSPTDTFLNLPNTLPATGSTGSSNNNHHNGSSTGMPSAAATLLPHCRSDHPPQTLLGMNGTVGTAPAKLVGHNMAPTAGGLTVCNATSGRLCSTPSPLLSTSGRLLATPTGCTTNPLPTARSRSVTPTGSLRSGGNNRSRCTTPIFSQNTLNSSSLLLHNNNNSPTPSMGRSTPLSTTRGRTTPIRQGGPILLTSLSTGQQQQQQENPMDSSFMSATTSASENPTIDTFKLTSSPEDDMHSQHSYEHTMHHTQHTLLQQQTVSLLPKGGQQQVQYSVLRREQHQQHLLVSGAEEGVVDENQSWLMQVEEERRAEMERREQEKQGKVVQQDIIQSEKSHRNHTRNNQIPQTAVDAMLEGHSPTSVGRSGSATDSTHSDCTSSSSVSSEQSNNTDASATTATTGLSYQAAGATSAVGGALSGAVGVLGGSPSPTTDTRPPAFTSSLLGVATAVMGGGSSTTPSPLLPNTSPGLAAGDMAAASKAREEELRRRFKRSLGILDNGTPTNIGQ